MKTHAIIPIFIPHEGCPYDCVFCNQKKITARSTPVLPNDVEAIIETHLATLRGRGLKTIEAAFYGGSFTGLPFARQAAYLAAAAKYKTRGLIDKLRLSTRPDYIDETVLDLLEGYGVDVVELGVQSFDDEVLRLSGRGHDADCARRACALLRSRGFTLGIQLMIGLPGDTPEKALYSTREAVKAKPAAARLYPTVILRDTPLCDLYLRGEYTPLSTDEAVAVAKSMYAILAEAGVTILRVGLKSTDLISAETDKRSPFAPESAVVGNTFHPAFRQLVEGELAKERLEQQLSVLFPELSACALTSAAPPPLCRAAFRSSSGSFSNLIGHKRVNRQYFETRYPRLNISWEIDSSLADGQYLVIKY